MPSKDEKFSDDDYTAVQRHPDDPFEWTGADSLEDLSPETVVNGVNACSGEVLSEPPEPTIGPHPRLVPHSTIARPGPSTAPRFGDWLRDALAADRSFDCPSLCDIADAIDGDAKALTEERDRLRLLLERRLMAARTAGIDLDLAADISRELGKP